MTLKNLVQHRLTLMLLSIGIGLIFIWAGWTKIRDPISFADSIHSFQILPEKIIIIFALGLPVLEILLGILLISGFLRRPSALGLLLLTLIFLVALGVAKARGLSVNCGCFGSTSGPSNLWVAMGRDVLILLGSVLIYTRELKRKRDSQL